METEEILAAIQQAADTIAAPNWVAIASVAISFLAVIVAGFVAWKQSKIAIEQNKIAKKQGDIAASQAEISEQQNKIALFEKKFFIYYEISKIVNLGQVISTYPQTTLKWIIDTELASLGCTTAIDTKDPKKAILDSIFVSRTLTSIKQAVFLFPEIEEKDVNELCKKYIRFFYAVIIEASTNPDTTIEKFTSATKSDFIAVSEEFKTKYLSYIVQNLHLTR